MMTEESVLRMTADINPAYSAEATKKAAAEAQAAATEKEAAVETAAVAIGKDTDAATGTAHAVKEKGTANTVRLRIDAIPGRNVNNQTVTLQR